MRRTLIVDDMKEVYDRLRCKFKNPGYANTVEKGLEEIASGNYNSVISDYDLGEESPKGGLEIIRAAQDKGLKRILMSKENHRKEAEKLGVRFMFKKELFKLKVKDINKLLMGYDGRKQG